MEIVSWFSAGAASTIATKFTLQKFAGNNISVARIILQSEHDDNERYSRDVSRWLGIEIIELSNKKYSDSWSVFEDKNYIKNQYGAPCTLELKKRVREEYEREHAPDLQIFGYTFEEKHRADKLKLNFPELPLEFPLIDKGLTKADCLAMVINAGIELPTMYRLGYNNNNCIGCPKGGMGYWNKIRVDFPEAFRRMSSLERKFKYSLFDCYLDELAPDAGRHNEPEISCSMFCFLAESDDDYAPHYITD